MSSIEIFLSRNFSSWFFIYFIEKFLIQTIIPILVLLTTIGRLFANGKMPKVEAFAYYLDVFAANSNNIVTDRRTFCETESTFRSLALEH